MNNLQTVDQKNGKTIVEINGIKLEVDLRTAKKIENYSIGDAIKVLVKTYDNSYKSYPGIIVGFDDFSAMPTILIAYLDLTYSRAELKMVCLNRESKDLEICAASKDELCLDKSSALELFDREITIKKRELEDLKNQKEYFEKKFSVTFKDLDKNQKKGGDYEQIKSSETRNT